MVNDLDAGSTYVATSDLGTSANNVVQLDGSAKLPAVDGSQLTGITDNGKVLQQVHAATSAVATGTTVFPSDDTVPQNTEGNEAITLAITPSHASNKLIISATIFHSSSAAAGNMGTALFQDSTAGALSAVLTKYANGGDVMTTSLVYQMAAGTTSATTFKIRCGSEGAGTWTLNGTGGARLLGGVASTTLTITEIGA